MPTLWSDHRDHHLHGFGIIALFVFVFPSSRELIMLFLMIGRNKSVCVDWTIVLPGCFGLSVNPVRIWKIKAEACNLQRLLGSSRLFNLL